MENISPTKSRKQQYCIQWRFHKMLMKVFKNLNATSCAVKSFLSHSHRYFQQRFHTLFRSSRSKMFFKIDVLKKFWNIHRKTTALESLFNKVAGLNPIQDGPLRGCLWAFSWLFISIPQNRRFHAQYSSCSCATAFRSSRLEGLRKISVTLLIRKLLKNSSRKGHF